MAGSLVDMTGMKNTREALSNSEWTLHQRTMLLGRFAESVDQIFWFIQLEPLRVIYASPAYERIWGTPIETLHQDPQAWLKVIHCEDRAGAAAALEAFLRGKVQDYRVEYRIQGADGTVRWIHDEGARMADDEGEVRWISGIARDITTLKKIEESLRESEGRFRLLADAAPVMIWMSGLDKGCTYFNRGWLEFTGRPIEREMGNGWADNVHPDDLPRCLETYSSAFDARQPFSMEYRLLHHDGSYRWIWDKGVPREEQSGSFAGYVGACIDITDRKRLETEQRALSRRLISAQEVERTGIARELHDDIGQRLALLEVKLEQLTAKSKRWTQSERSLIQNLRQQIREIGSDVQHISHQLHPSKLGLLGLSAAVKSFCREIEENGAVQIDCACHDIPPSLPKEIALCLYRVVQEGVANILKHSGARHADVVLSGTRDAVILRITDMGKGFDPESDTAKQGLGLVSMRERVRLIGGELWIRSEPSHGASIEVRVPSSL